MSGLSLRPGDIVRVRSSFRALWADAARSDVVRWLSKDEILLLVRVPAGSHDAAVGWLGVVAADGRFGYVDVLNGHASFRT